MADEPINPQQAIDEASKKLEAAPVVDIPSPPTQPETVIISPKDQKPESPPQIPMQPKKKGGKGMLIGMLVFLILTLPVAVYYGSQQYKQITERRGRAVGITGPYPPWSACNNIGDTSTSPKGNCLECKTNTSGGPNPAWAPCGGVSDCPWTPSAETNNMCCPTGTDACSTLGDKMCVPDPFISICSVWDTGCPAGHQNYWKHLETVTSCDNTPTPTDEPGATNTPRPTATNTPVPTATNTPVPTATNTPTNTPTITPTSAPGTCDASCDTDSNCGSGLSCVTSTGVKRCRKAACPDRLNCECPIAGSTATPTTRYYQPGEATDEPVIAQAPIATATQRPTPKVPVSGTIDVKAIVITIGSMLLLALGLIL